MVPEAQWVLRGQWVQWVLEVQWVLRAQWGQVIQELLLHLGVQWVPRWMFLVPQWALVSLVALEVQELQYNPELLCFQVIHWILEGQWGLMVQVYWPLHCPERPLNLDFPELPLILLNPDSPVGPVLQLIPVVPAPQLIPVVLVNLWDH